MEKSRLSCALGLRRETLSAWRDRLLPEAEAERIALHVTNCAACQHHLTQFTQIATALQQQPAPDLRAQTWRGLQARLPQKEQQPMRFPRAAAFSGIGAVALLALIVILFVLVLNQRPGTNSGPGTGTATATVIATPTFTPVATSTVTAPDCSSAFLTYSPNYVQQLPDPHYTSTQVFANIPLPPLSRIVPNDASGGQRGYDICSGGTVASITSFMTQQLTNLGWATTGGGAWTQSGYTLTVLVPLATNWNISWHDPDFH
jgi:hypothetical protein